MINHKVLLAVVLAAASLIPAAVNAQGISISIGDRAYARHGYSYYDNGRQYAWVPGHWARHHRVWVHGHYAVRDRDRAPRIDVRRGY